VKTLPKTLSPAYPEQDISSRTRFRRLCSHRYRARGASDGDATESSKHIISKKMLSSRNTSRPSVRPHRHITASARQARARACGTPISFIELHKRYTERLHNKLDGRLLRYPYGISLFSLALNTWTFNSFIITINDPRPIYSNILFILLFS
jgi:hypothetical protein